jgi:hypothetical protein
MQTHDEKLDAAIEHMFGLEDAYELALIGEADAEYAYDQGFAEEHLKASGTLPDKKEIATQKTAQQQKAHLRAKAAAKFLAVKVKNAQTAVSARQSLLNANLKTI